MQTILITGGTGLIGTHLTKLLVARGYQVIILTRQPDKENNNKSATYAAWDIKKQVVDLEAVLAADAIIHLAGAGVVDKSWTLARKKEIVESRTHGIRLLIDVLKNNPHKVKTIVSASAIGWYGPDKEPGHYFDETEKANDDFLGHTCLLWEQAVEEAIALGIRVCKLRTGIVLSNDGGALEAFKKPLRFGIATILSSGKQMISWIHIEDLCRIYLQAIKSETMIGSFNAVTPAPVTNKELMLSLARWQRGNFFIPMHVPGILLKVVLGQRSIEVLKSTTVSCAKIKETGFTFLYPSLTAALEGLSDKIT